MRAAATTCLMRRPQMRAQERRRNAELNRNGNSLNRKQKRNEIGAQPATRLLIRDKAAAHPSAAPIAAFVADQDTRTTD